MSKEFETTAMERAPPGTGVGGALSSLQRWGRLLALLRPHRSRMFWATLLVLVEAASALIAPLLVVQLLVIAVSEQGWLSLDMAMLALAGTFLAQSAAHFGQSYLLNYIGESLVYDLRTRLYSHLLNLSMDFHAASAVGDMTSRLSSDVTQLRSMLTTNVAAAISQFIQLVGAALILLAMNMRFAVFILVLLAVTFLVTTLFAGRIDRRAHEIQDHLAGATGTAERGLQGIHVVKCFGNERYEGSRYRQALDKVFAGSVRLNFDNALLNATMMFFSWIFIGAIMGFGGREVIAGRLTLPEVTGFLFYGLTISSAVRVLGETFSQASAAMGGIGHIFAILDRKPSVQDVDDAAALPDVDGAISFQNVNFSYGGKANVIDDLSLDIAAGETLALVGPSGAGKSTICNLVCRFYDPQAGRVLIDGRDVRSIIHKSLLERVAVVSQEPILFGGTIKENILYGRRDAREQEIMAATVAANAHEFIMSFPDGYNTPVGQRGMRLSGGQRQRIAIARALLRDPKILLLDEPTSALDNESERLVQDALERLMKSRTTLIIAHRLSTIRAADRIAVLENGRICGLGTHTELISSNPLYARLYDMQFEANLKKAAPERAS